MITQWELIAGGFSKLNVSTETDLLIKSYSFINKDEVRTEMFCYIEWIGDDKTPAWIRANIIIGKLDIGWIVIDTDTVEDIDNQVLSIFDRIKG